jgi:hypothetical protein
MEDMEEDKNSGNSNKAWGENAQGSAVSTLYISMYLEKRLAGKFDI